MRSHKKTIKQFINQIQGMKHDLNINDSNDSFTALMIKTYHQYALSFIEGALHSYDLNQLQHALHTHWNHINGNALCYTALPNDPITQLFCDIAKFLASQFNSTAISLLMPTVSTESQFADFPDLTTVDIHTVIRTHILGPNGAYLIPVSLLSKREATSDVANAYPSFDISTIDIDKLMSPYYQYDLHGEHVYLDRATVERLFSHCSETDVIFDAIKQYQRFMQDAQNLLGQLMQLTTRLEQNSINGLGHEYEAGKNGFVAIATFFEYYNHLTHSQQFLIPQNVKCIIDKILHYGSEPTRLADGTIVDRASEMGTCIASISANLSVVINDTDNQTILSTINITKQKKENLLGQIRTQFHHGQMQLKRHIENANHFGRDLLGVTPNLLQLLSLEKQFHIRSDQQLQMLMRLTPKEITTLCEAIPHIRDEIVTTIKNIENLVLFIFENSDEKIAGLFQAIGDKLTDRCNGILKDAKDFGIVLGPFENDQYHHLLLSFKNHLHTQITTTLELARLTQPLNTIQRSALYQLLINHLPGLVKNAVDFNYLAKTLNEEQRTELYQLLKIRLPLLVRYACSFHRITLSLNDEQKAEIFDAIKHKLLSLIKNASDFYLLAENLSAEKRTELFEAVKDWLAPLITTQYDFFCIVNYLNSNQRFFVCKKMHNKLPNLIQNPLYPALNRTFEFYVVARFLELFPTLMRQPAWSSKNQYEMALEDLITEAEKLRKNRAGLFTNRSSQTHMALKELGITNNLQSLTALTLYEKTNDYLSAMQNNNIASGSVRRTRTT